MVNRERLRQEMILASLSTFTCSYSDAGMPVSHFSSALTFCSIAWSSLQGNAESSYIHYLATQDKRACSKCFLKHIIVFSWCVAICSRSEVVVWTRNW
jgi:hypothetical protein